MGVCSSAQRPSAETALTLQGALPTLALVTPPGANARVEPAERKTTVDDPERVRVKAAALGDDELGSGTAAHTT